jgi:hypothetical protein
MLVEIEGKTRKPRTPKAPIEPIFKLMEVFTKRSGPGGGKARGIVEVFGPVMEKVRRANGRTALILQHPKPEQTFRKLKNAFAEFVFSSRKVPVDGKDVVFIWARLREPIDTPIPDAESPNELQTPELG